MMKCSNCGAPLIDEDIFCPRCGKRVERIDFDRLTDAIRDQTGMTYPESEEFAWRILHEYPADFQAAAAALMENRVPDFHVGSISLTEVVQTTGRPAFDVLEILRISQKDPEFARKFLIRYSPTDWIG